MRLLEHQAKTILSEFGLRFTEPRLAGSPEAVVDLATKLAAPVMVKAQVPFGGRGKQGAVRSADTPEQAGRVAADLLGSELCGMTIATVSVELRVAPQREFYIGMAWDTAARLPTAILSAAGGVSIEEADPGQVWRRTFDPWVGLRAYEGRELAARAGLRGRILAVVGRALEDLSRAFLACDALVAEVNPLAETKEGELIGLDAHLEIEDDALWRQGKRLASLGGEFPGGTGRPPTRLESEAQRIDAMDHRGVAGRVVEFDGDLALLIGGGGASLTVFDAIRRHGGRPANYCEVGGNPTEEKVAALTELLLSKPGVRKLAVIMNVVNNTRADVMAEGVLRGLERAHRVPGEALVVFRVPGSWEDEARERLHPFGIVALGREVSLDAAARLAVERMRGVGSPESRASADDPWGRTVHAR